MTKSLSPHRFDLYALGVRSPLIRLMTDECSYWSNLDETIIGTVVYDRTDSDYGWVALARDRIGRFRWVAGNVSLKTERQAEAALRLKIGELEKQHDVGELGVQWDEPNAPFDLLTVSPDIDREKLHLFFRELIDRPGREPARAIIREIGPWLAPKDPHFVREFQQTQFDQRLWELYLWSVFRELGFDVEQLEAPDFMCTAPGIAFCIEATTAAPSTQGALADHPNPQTIEERIAFLNDYMPIKYGSCLFSKVNKKNSAGLHYWEREESKDKPFIIAVADFHKPGGTEEIGSMTFTQSALWPYLYGQKIKWEIRDDGQLDASDNRYFETGVTVVKR